MTRTKSKESMLSQRLGRAVANQRKTAAAEPEVTQDLVSESEQIQAEPKLSAEKTAQTAESRKKPKQTAKSEPDTSRDNEITELKQMVNALLTRVEEGEKQKKVQTDEGDALKKEKRRLGRPRTTVQTGPSRYKGLQPGQERATVIFDSDQISRVRDIADARNMSLRELMKEIIGTYLENADTK